MCASRTGDNATGARASKSSPPAWGQRNGGSNGAKDTGKPGAAKHSSAAPRKDARGARGSRKPSMTAGTKPGGSKRFGFTARSKQEAKKRA